MILVEYDDGKSGKMAICPRCGEDGFPAAMKIFIRPTESYPCDKCGTEISTSPMEYYTSYGVTVVSLTTFIFMPLEYAITIALLSGVVSLILMLKWVKLVD